jgi:hypothetical protein
MRDPAPNLAEDWRVKDAIEEARRHLARLAMDITSWTDQGANTLDPEQERRHAIAIVKQVADNLADPQLSSLLRKAVPALKRTRPAKKLRGRNEDCWNERNRLIVEAIELVCVKYGFDPTRNPASSNECGCSIVSKALDALGIKLSTKTILNIWNKS